MKKIIIGILAHVDAGKTTLSEGMLYLSGNIKQLGRVDHQDAFLDYNQLERQRGITIFSKQAMFDWKNTSFTLIDTPGHSDFSTEMERTLKVLDYAILVISGTDGVQSHTETIWQLLQEYHVPTFIFVNKMDLPTVSHDDIMKELQEKLSENCIDFQTEEDMLLESLAVCNEKMLDQYVENGTIDHELICEAIASRQIFPCFYGSALKLEGVEVFLNAMDEYMLVPGYPNDFGAFVYKISRDEQGNRLAHMKFNGGSLKVKTTWLEDNKVDKIRLYSGVKYTTVNEVQAGEICIVQGCKTIEAGMGLGIEESFQHVYLSSYMNYRIVLPPSCDEFKMYRQLLLLEEEDPQLHITYQEDNKEIRIQLMGEIQIEVLQKMIEDRFGVKVEFYQGNIVYKETIAEAVEGVGHYEPLRHYAEVHLLLEPGKRGSGIVVENKCRVEDLSPGFQQLIMTHILEKEHVGVLTGSPITDIKITLLGGRANVKHTEGGDFRQATYRAIRQGLKSTASVLLEPYYQFTLEIGNEYISKAMFDLEKMQARFQLDDSNTDKIQITGRAPVRLMQNYQTQVLTYTKGEGRFHCFVDGYEPCEQASEIIESIHYDSEADLENPTDSIFCAHGAGFHVPYDKVKDYMHLPFYYQQKVEREETTYKKERFGSSDEELEAIFTRTYGKTKRFMPVNKANREEEKQAAYERKEECLLVDGYNVIHAL